MNKVIILDRDGVLNVNSRDINSPYYYILNKKDLILKDGVIEAISSLKKHKLILATRQKCISKKLITRKQAEEINDHLCEMIGCKFEEIYIQEDGDDKQPTFELLIEKYGKENLILFDDSEKECDAAIRLGIKTVLTENILKAINNESSKLFVPVR